MARARANLLPRTSAQWLEWLFAALAVLAITQLVYLMLSRIQYPYELEWMEGATVDTFARVLRGGVLYTAPNIDYIPPIYGPAYFYLGALFPLTLGVNLFSARLLSVLATLGILAVLYHWVRREKGSAAAGLVACGLFAISFEALGGWFDLARVDSLYLLLVLLGAYSLRFASTWRGLIVSAVCLSLATFVKINAVFVLIFLIPFVLLTFRKRAVWWLGALALIGGGVTALFTLISGEWFLYFVLARSTPDIVPPSDWLTFWTQDLARLWLALILGLGCIAWLARTKQLDRFRFYVYFALGMLLAAWVARVHHGSWVNADFTAYAVVILLAGIGLSRVVAALRTQPRSWLAAAAALLVAAQFWTLRYDSSAHLPTAADAAAGNAFVDRLAQVQGDVLLFAHGDYPRMAGVPAAESGWLMIMNHGERTGAKAGFDESVRGAIAQQRFSVIVTDNAVYLHEDYLDALNTNYQPQDLRFDGRAFFPVEGQQTRPLLWWTPRQR